LAEGAAVMMGEVRELQEKKEKRRGHEACPMLDARAATTQRGRQDVGFGACFPSKAEASRRGVGFFG